jgi:hypothetical protein
MSRKPKFRPEIRRIKLNPEQAVLTCSCYSSGHRPGSYMFYPGGHQLGGAWTAGICGAHRVSNEVNYTGGSPTAAFDWDIASS